MKKYLREIEISAFALMLIGIILSLLKNTLYGGLPCLTGIMLIVISVVYKAFHWNEYATENKRNVAIMLLTIFILVVSMILKK